MMFSRNLFRYLDHHGAASVCEYARISCSWPIAIESWILHIIRLLVDFYYFLRAVLNRDF